MTNQEIQELIDIFNASGLAEMEVQRDTGRLRLTRSQSSYGPALNEVSAGASHASPLTAQPIPPPAPAAKATASPAKPAAPESEYTTVKSPIVGTYYDSPSPGAAPFVKVGDSVEPGQPLCIIESMKLMNEIEAEIAGIVVHKLCENGRPVEYGEALFAIRPR